jgi:hypothetical protein
MEFTPQAYDSWVRTGQDPPKQECTGLLGAQPRARPLAFLLNSVYDTTEFNIT